MRYLVQYFVEKGMSSTFPLGTLIANIAGSFIIGIVFALAEKGNLLSAEWRIFLAVGICGGFTTFSTFAYENHIYLKGGDYFGFLPYIIVTFILAISAVFLGMYASKFI